MKYTRGRIISKVEEQILEQKFTRSTADVPLGRKSSMDMSGNMRPILEITSSTYLSREGHTGNSYSCPRLMMKIQQVH